jgi:hypothetical protein
MGNNPEPCEKAEQDHRKIHINKSAPIYGYNEVKSTSASWLTFVPLNLINQLRTMANCTYNLSLV